VVCDLRIVPAEANVQASLAVVDGGDFSGSGILARIHFFFFGTEISGVITTGASSLFRRLRPEGPLSGVGARAFVTSWNLSPRLAYDLAHTQPNCTDFS
jgi:hypothetical protein